MSRLTYSGFDGLPDPTKPPAGPIPACGDAFSVARRGIEAEAVIASTIDRICRGLNSDPDALMCAVMNVAAIDGHLIHPTDALRQGMRRLQKHVEREASVDS